MTRRIAARAMALGLVFLCSSSSSSAEPGKRVALDPVGDGIALSTGIAAALAAELLIEAPAASGPRPEASAIPGIDAMARFSYYRPLDIASEVLQYGTMLWPACFALIGERDELLGAAAAAAEALAWTYAAKEAGKALFPRWRPYAYGDEPLSDELAEESRQSFPSGHAALAFSAATAFATLALETAGDEPATPWLVAGGYAAAAGVAALRVASGNHFLTDVVAGAALGSAIGYAAAIFHVRDAAGEGADARAGSLSFSAGGGPCFAVTLRY